ncbi:hypothetical protein VM1G_03863 [Cytospora mali]|uniref:Uncharacterized protein n=1 Tax=Cytospora mali TaxID=578113 RepID=A0A194VXT2_CYTMA|nr:hypothetical protein VM1G_03863 [Valsa mali]
MRPIIIRSHHDLHRPPPTDITKINQPQLSIQRLAMRRDRERLLQVRHHSREYVIKPRGVELRRRGRLDRSAVRMALLQQLLRDHAEPLVPVLPVRGRVALPHELGVEPVAGHYGAREPRDPRRGPGALLDEVRAGGEGGLERGQGRGPAAEERAEREDQG